MVMRLGRSIGAMALVLAMATIGCGGGGSSDPGPRNTMVINGTEVAISAVDVWFDADIRYVRFTDPIGDYVELVFEHQGDPLAYQIPFGTWSGFDADLTEVAVYLAADATDATYNGNSPYSCRLAAGGHEPDTLRMESAWTFHEGPVSDVDISYAGPYVFGADN